MQIMKGLFKARGICLRIRRRSPMDTAQHKASTRSSLRSSPWPTERCARTPHCACRVISRTASTSRGLGAADRGATARRAAPIGCLNRVLPDSRSAAFAYVVYNLLGIGCPRRSRSLRCGEQCIASRSMSNGYIFIQRFSATWTNISKASA